MSTNLNQALRANSEAVLASQWRSEVGKSVPLFLLILGFVVRFRTFLFNRSLWLDEAMLAVNIAGRSYRQLTEPLDYNQAAPIGFLWAQRLCFELFGPQDYSLRVVPLLAAGASLLLFYLLARRLLSAKAAIIALALFVLAPRLIYYSTEAKQYSLDVLLCLAMLAAVVLLDVRRRRLPWYLLGLVGGVAIWCSHPVIFVLAAIGIAFVITLVRDRNWKVLSAVFVAWLVWVGSFAAHYLFILRLTSTDVTLRGYWQPAFAPMPFTSVENMQWFADAFFGVFRDPAGILRGDIAAFFYVVGAIELWQRRQRLVLALLTLPILFTLVASALHRYPFSDRLLLFLVPSFFLLIAAGIEPILRMPRQAARSLMVVVLVLLLSDSAVNAVYRFMRPREHEEIRSAISYVRVHRDARDVVYVHPRSVPAFKFYARQQGFSVEEAILGQYQRLEHQYREEAGRIGSKRVWMISSQMTEPDRDQYGILTKLLNSGRTRLVLYEATGARAELYSEGQTLAQRQPASVP